MEETTLSITRQGLVMHSTNRNVQIILAITIAVAAIYLVKAMSTQSV